MIDICEIFTHWHGGRSKNEIAGSLGLSRNTVRKYLAAAEAAGMAPGGPAVSQREWAELARRWFPELADTRLRQVTWPAIEEHRDYIVAQLAAGVTMATIHQRLADERGLAASVASLRRYVAANLPEEARRSQVTVLRLVPAEAGQEAQIDYGQIGRWTDPSSGRRHTVNAFAMVLCCSRHMFVRPVITMDQHAWTECLTRCPAADSAITSIAARPNRHIFCRAERLGLADDSHALPPELPCRLLHLRHRTAGRAQGGQVQAHIARRSKAWAGGDQPQLPFGLVTPPYTGRGSRSSVWTIAARICSLSHPARRAQQGLGKRVRPVHPEQTSVSLAGSRPKRRATRQTR